MPNKAVPNKVMSGKAMKYQSNQFLRGTDEPEIVVSEGISRQLLGYDDSILMARAIFAKDAIGYKHTHPHSQLTYVESGVFDFTIGSETRRLRTGDGTYVPPFIEHGAVCIEAGVLLDVFSPIREDFLAEN